MHSWRFRVQMFFSEEIPLLGPACGLQLLG